MSSNRFVSGLSVFVATLNLLVVMLHKLLKCI